MKIVDQFGNPMNTASLEEPQTARIALLAQRVVDSQLDGLTPARAARILRAADQGDILAQHQLFDDMIDRDAHLRCEFDKRTGAPLTLDWHIEPPADANRAEKKAASMIEQMLRDTVDDLEDVISISKVETTGFSRSALAPLSLAAVDAPLTVDGAGFSAGSEAGGLQSPTTRANPPTSVGGRSVLP